MASPLVTCKGGDAYILKCIHNGFIFYYMFSLKLQLIYPKLVKPYIQYFGRLEASQNNIVHFDMKKSISVDGILVEYVGSSCFENVISIKMRVPLIHYSEM